MAVLLTIITYFSTPILTKIFGDGSLEVGEAWRQNIEKNCPFLTRGRTSRTGPTTASQPTWRYVTFSPYSGFELFLHQQVDQETNNSDTQEAAKQAEHLDMTTLPSDSEKVNRLSKEAI